MPVLVVDSSAWIGAGQRSLLGEELRAQIEAGDEVETPTSVISEVARFALRNGADVRKALRVVLANSRIVPIDAQIAETAAQLHHERRRSKKAKWGIMDAYVLAVARLHDGEILTADNDFSDLDEAIIPRRDGSVKRSRRAHDEDVP